jgi:CRISPR-associated endonuclease/helicase Cas3
MDRIIYVSPYTSIIELEKQFALLRRAQRFTVDVFPNVMEKLQRAGAVYEAQKTTRAPRGGVLSTLNSTR